MLRTDQIRVHFYVSSLVLEVDAASTTGEVMESIYRHPEIHPAPGFSLYIMGSVSFSVCRALHDIDGPRSTVLAGVVLCRVVILQFFHSPSEKDHSVEMKAGAFTLWSCFLGWSPPCICDPRDPLHSRCSPEALEPPNPDTPVSSLTTMGDSTSNVMDHVHAYERLGSSGKDWVELDENRCV